MSDDKLLKWFRFTDRELNALLRAFAIQPGDLSTRQQRLLREIEMALAIRAQTPYE